MSFKVTVEPSGHTFMVNEGEVILDAALRQGLATPYGCRNGVCGACTGKVVEGEVFYAQGRPGALSVEEEAIGQTLLCQALLRSDVTLELKEISSVSDLKIHKLSAKVVRMERLADDVMRLALKLPESESMSFLAGQYIDILLEDGGRRSFSIANPPRNDGVIELHIRHVDGGQFTSHLFAGMQEQSLLTIEGPFGDFYLREASLRPTIFVAGGTGFAPVKGIIEHLLAEGVARPIYLYWGARSVRDLYLNELAQHWAQRENFYYIPVLSAAQPEDGWSGRSGDVHQAVAADFAELGGYDLYVAGPPLMVSAARDSFVQRGLAEEQFFFDSFELAPKGSA